MNRFTVFLALAGLVLCYADYYKVIKAEIVTFYVCLCCFFQAFMENDSERTRLLFAKHI